MFMIDYRDSICFKWGVFPTREDAQRFIDTFATKEEARHYLVFEVPVNDGSVHSVNHTAPHDYYTHLP